MTSVFIFMTVLAVLAFLGFLYWQKTQKPAVPQDLLLNLISDLRRDVQESSGKNRQEIDGKLDRMTEIMKDHQHASLKNLQDQFKTSHDIIQEVTKNLTHLKETNRQVVGFAEQMKSLENILKNPKQRGILGEFVLESLLGNVLTPAQFQMQYKMKNGEIVDAVIFERQSLIPIDAKFSLEKYNLMMEETDKDKRDQLEKAFKADLKMRIDETAKYIRPEEGTTDFAFMFIPAEGIYYNLLVYNVGSVNVSSQDLIEYAHKKKVNIVSPSTFYAYLKTILAGMRAIKIEESVQAVIGHVEQLGRHLRTYDDKMQKLGKHLGTAVGAYNEASSEYRKVDKDMLKITDGRVERMGEMPLLEKPLESETLL